MFENPIARVQQRIVEVIQEEVQKWVKDLMKDAFNPAAVMQFLKGMGIDMSGLPGMVGQQPGFDAYAILGLDKSASDEEVRKRYHELLHHLHPDTAGMEGTSFLLQMVMAAYEMIKRDRGWQ
jgi:DnaJ-domain-containing protein 1